jgi:hypothetical protein
VNTELHAVDIRWTLSPASELMLSDDDIRRERDLFRQTFTLALGLLYDGTQELARVREQYRTLREQVVQQERSR